MPANQLVCTECLSADLSLAECTWSNPATKDIGQPPPKKGWFKSYERAQREYNLWARNGWKLHCPNGHLLPPESHQREMVVIALWGETGAGKTAFVKALVNHLELENTLKPVGVTGQLAGASRQSYKREYLNRNEPTQPVLSGQPPRKPLIIELTANGRTTNVLLYDTSGEEGKTDEEAHEQYPFAHIADVLLFFATPATLEKLPASARIHGGRSTQTRENTSEKFQTAINAAKGAPDQFQQRKNHVIPIFVLSKADQLSTAPGFPREVLEPRDYRHGIDGVIKTINREMTMLPRYISDNGGEPLLDRVLSFNGKGRCIAVSGTGTDDDSPQSGHSARFGAPNRCLDPLLIALWELGFLSEERQ